MLLARMAHNPPVGTQPVVNVPTWQAISASAGAAPSGREQHRQLTVCQRTLFGVEGAAENCRILPRPTGRYRRARRVRPPLVSQYPTTRRLSHQAIAPCSIGKTFLAAAGTLMNGQGRSQWWRTRIAGEHVRMEVATFVGGAVILVEVGGVGLAPQIAWECGSRSSCIVVFLVSQVCR